MHFTLVHRYDFITGKRADIRRGDPWGWGFFHERLIRPYIYVDETIGVGNKKQTRPIVVRCPQRRSPLHFVEKHILSQGNLIQRHRQRVPRMADRHRDGGAIRRDAGLREPDTPFFDDDQ